MNPSRHYSVFVESNRKPAIVLNQYTLRRDRGENQGVHEVSIVIHIDPAQGEGKLLPQLLDCGQHRVDAFL